MALSKLGQYDDEFSCEIADAYSKLQEKLTCLLPDSIDTLDRLQASGVRMGLITNEGAEGQWAKIRRFNLEKYFEFCLVEGEIGIGKPDIKVFELALEYLGLSANEVWMVGDNLEWDVGAPQKLGIFSIWKDPEGKGLPADSPVIPDRIINSLSELLI